MGLREKLTDTVQVFLVKQRQSIATAVMVIIIVLSIWFFLIPLVQTCYELSLKASSIKSEVLSAKYDEEQRARMDQTFMWSKTRLALDEYTIGQDEVSGYLESFTILAKESGVRLLSMQPIKRDRRESSEESDKAEKPPYEFADVEMVASAGYHQLGEFIARIEGQPVFMYITSLDIKADPATPLEHDIRLSIRMLHETGKTATR